jgi:hypothetical protein
MTTRTKQRGTLMSSRPEPVSRALRIRLGHLLIMIALVAVSLALLIPKVKRAYFPETWNTWIVRTVTRPDGALVRLRIRRYPDRDAVFQEILKRPQPEQTDLVNQQTLVPAGIPPAPQELSN